MNSSFDLSAPNSTMDALITDRVVSIDIFNMGIIILITTILLVIVLIIVNQYLKDN
jgi:hypothetical protein